MTKIFWTIKSGRQCQTTGFFYFCLHEQGHLKSLTNATQQQMLDI